MDVTAIRSVTVSVYQGALDLLENVKAHTPYLAKFNLPFCIATALNFGHVDLDDFTDKRLIDPKILTLMDLISLKEDPKLTRQYPQKWPSRVEILAANGKTYKEYCEFPKGDPENPFSEKELIQKFNKLCGNIITKHKKDRIIDLALNLEKVDDVANMFQG